MDFLIATTNPGKAKEFREMLGEHRFHWLTLADVPNLPDVEETGHTFRANAILKASTYAKSTGLWTMADDSGLVVDALDKNPGIYSARWAKMHNAGAGDEANNALLLAQLKDIPLEIPTPPKPVSEVLRRAGSSEIECDNESGPSEYLRHRLGPSQILSPRRARFVCVLAVCDPQGRTVFTTRATMEGRIGLTPVGSNGFGYDPLFKVDGMDRTSAELPPAEKHRISHRGRALERMKPLLESIDFKLRVEGSV